MTDRPDPIASDEADRPLNPLFSRLLAPLRVKLVRGLIRWGIAIAGIAIVLWNISLRDRVLALGVAGSAIPREVRLVEPAPEVIRPETELAYIDFGGGTLRGSDLVYRPDRKMVRLRDGTTVRLLAMDLTSDPKSPQVRRLLVAASTDASAAPSWILPQEVSGGFELRVPSPLVDRGVRTMLARADKGYLWLAVAVFPVVFLLTALRWQQLLRAVGIHLPFSRTFALNMVGCFYNSFMPGSTGGDVLKAYYAAKQTRHFRTRAVMSVIIDRIIGLLALVILGGSMAGIQWMTASDGRDPATRKSVQVAVGSMLILGAVAVALCVLYVPALRRYTGLGFVLGRLPMQAQVGKALETMELYRRRPGLVLGALLLTLPVHGTVVVSAMLSGMAFGLPLPAWYYFVAVPVIVLSGSIPISPQGAGVMEFFAIVLTRRAGCTIGEAFALTMCIRLVQIFWNLTGGLFVIKGGYHSPTQQEQASLVEEEEPAAVEQR
ncbi:MAG: flippase-like domain-containing protein [Phycisphaerae bacterium]|nr:flippase-like domain-containing protein [Phycisphaerae bacterium]MDW8261142.1 lysylphosphatidylglycerol synthase transmembrane domain-containing protein [Phycisphaerales bacterium]